MIIYYRPTAEGGLAQETIDRLAAIARDQSRVIMAPYPALPDDRAFALSPGTRWMCPATISANQAVTVTTSFIDAFRGTSVAPEAPRGLLGPLARSSAAAQASRRCARVVGVAGDDAPLEARPEVAVGEPVDVGGREPEATSRAALEQIAVQHQAPQEMRADRPRVEDRPIIEFLALAAAAETWRDVGSPGEQPRPSYLARISPVMRRSALIHSRSSGRPRLERNLSPLIAACPFAPLTVTDMILPETPRSTLVNPVTAPMPSPRWWVASAGVNVCSQTAFGFAEV